MLEKTAQLLKVLKEAIRVENDGYHFYRIAAQKTDDSKGKRVFASLAQDELDHGSMLKGLYQAIENAGEPKFDRKKWMKKKPRTRSKSPIFTAEFKGKIKGEHFALSALRIGQLLERDSIDFYSKNAKRAKHPELKSLLNFMVQWERDHLKALVDQENFLVGKL
jgi:rubrerythrin